MINSRPGFTNLPPMAGVTMATGRLGHYPDRDDLLLVHFKDTANCGGVFTRSSTRSDDIDRCRHALKQGGGKARILVVNSGNSNAFTGPQGLAKNAATLASASQLANCPEHQIFLSATGVIGEPMPTHLVAKALPGLWPNLQIPDWHKATHAIMTTDLMPKIASARIPLGDTCVNLIGMAKGSGMIAPNMATMLAYIFTDAALSPALCQSLLNQHVETSFNAITVDGDTSTSDTLMLFATGKAGGTEFDTLETPDSRMISEGIATLMQDLAIQIVRDGEGAQKLIEIHVYGAQTDQSARRIAGSIANSPLVKTAIAASDANWGRIIMAAGKAGEPFGRDTSVLHVGEVEIACEGGRSPRWSEAAASEALAGDHVCIRLDAGTGGCGASTIWTCDLTHGYIDINGHYRS